MPQDAAILFYVDGVQVYVMEEMLAAGELPNLQRFFVDGGVTVTNAITSVPSVTFANAASMVTGVHPGVHQAWANKWFDRNLLFTRNYEQGRDAIDEDMACPTIFELCPETLTGGVGSAVQRGVKLPVAVSLKTGGLGVGLAYIVGAQDGAEDQMANAVYQLGEHARELGRWPDLSIVYLFSPDVSGHEAGPSSEQYRESMRNMDASVGELLGAFANAGMLDQLTIALTADHGHHDTPHSLPLGEFLSETLPVNVLFTERDEDGVDYIDRWKRYKDADVVVTVAGERQASLHVRAGERWCDRPTLSQIVHLPWVPDVETSAQRPTLPELLLAEPAVDFVCVRAGRDDVRLFGRRGSAAVERVLRDDESVGFRYQVLAGEDPLGYADDPRIAPLVNGREHDSRAWLEATAHHRHPDIVPQLVPAFDSVRAGDAIVFAAPGWDFSPDYVGGHGGIEAEEMRIPLFFAGPSLPRGVQLESARLVDLVPTLLELRGEPTPPDLDGVSLVNAMRALPQPVVAGGLSALVGTR